jgi:hypothetical protein
MKILDLHGARHYDVESLCHLFINDNWGKEMKIITGNSFMMKQIVLNILKFYKLDFKLDNPYNLGYIIVRK